MDLQKACPKANSNAFLEWRLQKLRRILSESVNPKFPDLLGHRRQIAADLGLDYENILKNNLR